MRFYERECSSASDPALMLRERRTARMRPQRNRFERRVDAWTRERNRGNRTMRQIYLMRIR